MLICKISKFKKLLILKIHRTKKGDKIMSRLTKRDAYWLGEEFWTSAEEPDDDEIDAVYCKLKDFEDLQDDGRLVVTPAKVGTKLYTIILGKVEEYTITGYSINEDGVWLANLEFLSNGKTYARTLETEDIGKTWYFTPEEAERKIKK